MRLPESRLASFEAVRSIDAGTYLETLLVSAIASVLAIRFFLQLTGFPQLGGGGLHIAHMLWGGLIMLAALVLTLVLIGHSAKQVGAAMGGVGFGFFIDELGKFLTSDNDYFFQPAIAIIYFLFVALFFVFRSIERRQPLSERELLVNAADTLVELILDRASPEERARALYLLQQSGRIDDLSAALRRAVLAADPAEPRRPSPAKRMADWLRHLYSRLIAWRWFHRAVIVLFGLRAGFYLAVAAAAFATLMSAVSPPLTENGFVAAGILVSSAAAAGLAAVGVVRLRRGRLSAFHWFKRSVLLSIFVVQVFLFYLDQLGALRGLALDIVLLLGLNYMLGEESARQEAAAVQRVASGARAGVGIAAIDGEKAKASRR